MDKDELSLSILQTGARGNSIWANQVLGLFTYQQIATLEQ
jgi:hypothetical protein